MKRYLAKGETGVVDGYIKTAMSVDLSGHDLYRFKTTIEKQFFAV
jgi:hypothetical protein